jgi:hypothetical protein
MQRLFASLLLSLACLTANASMIFFAVAVPADQAEQFVNDERQMLVVFRKKDGNVVNLDKAWHGLHYLFTGSPTDTRGALGQAILGGTNVGKDLGYGPARVLSPEQVKKVARALSEVTAEGLTAKYDVHAMQRAEVYPSIWVREGQEGLRFLLNYLPALQAFYKRAAEAGLSVVLILA